MTMIADMIGDRAHIKACANNFKRYAVRIDSNKRIGESTKHILGLLGSGAIAESDVIRSVPAQPPLVIEPTEPPPVVELAELEPQEEFAGRGLYGPNPNTGYGMVPVEVAAWLRKHKRGFILSHIAKGVGRNEGSVRHALEWLMGRGEVVKYKEGKRAYYKLGERQAER